MGVGVRARVRARVKVRVRVEVRVRLGFLRQRGQREAARRVIVTRHRG